MSFGFGTTTANKPTLFGGGGGAGGFAAAPAPFGATTGGAPGGGTAFSSAPQTNPFGGQQPQQQQQQQAQASSSFGTPAPTSGGLFGTNPQGTGVQARAPFGATSAAAPSSFGTFTGTAAFGAPASTASPFGGTGILSSTGPGIGGFGGGANAFGGAGGFGGFGQPQQQQQQQLQFQQQQQQQQGGFAGGQMALTPQQQEAQRAHQQRQFWDQELNMIRDAYTPAPAVLTPGTQQQRTVDYKFPFRVSITDPATGQSREVTLTNHNDVQAKLNQQRSEMQRIQQHLESLGKKVQGLGSEAHAAKDRLARCREQQMSLTNRFLVVLQRMQVMHNINRPFSATEKEMRERMEVMIGRLEDAIRTLNEVSGVVDEEEADLRDEPRQELTCRLAREDLLLLQQALGKQQEGLDYLTKTLARDSEGAELLKEKLGEGGRGVMM